MIPSVVARQVRETVLDYLRTTFALADPEFEQSLFEFLDSKEGLFRGPYFDVRLPFRKTAETERIPLDIRPDFAPYKHQQRSFERLFSRGGHQPQNTLVTTGTGSGKTECFLYPILDHCWRNRDEPGIKAIILYPMNALATDQSRRLAEMLWNDDRLRGQVTAGLYVGGKGQHGSADRDHLVDKRDVLRGSPPDILLTNYRMLDFLLLRPEDRRLWQHNGPNTLRYLALDELHTYDGAQGSDVACLIRRLKDRLSSNPGSICCVGTSATIGEGAKRETVAKLTGFATKVFDEDFVEESVITEDRYEIDDLLTSINPIDIFPGLDSVDFLRPENFDSADEWSAKQATLWLGEGAAEFSPVEIGAHLNRHGFLRALLRALGGSAKSWKQLDDALGPKIPEWPDFEEEEDRQRLLESFLSLISRARKPAPTEDKPDRTEPYLSVHAQLWLRELRHLVRRVLPESIAPEFAWADDGTQGRHDENPHWLPIAHCRECGSAGLATFQRASEQVLQTELSAIGRNWLTRSRTSRYVAFGHDRNPEGLPEGLCSSCLRVQYGGETAVCDQCKTAEEGASEPEALPLIPVRISSAHSDQTIPRFLANCPDCDSDGSLSMLGSRAPSLLSVAIGHLYQSEFNEDKKLLAFTDSVQDASHRAGFFAARTYRFNLRTAIQSVIEEGGDEGVSLAEFSERLWAYWHRTIKTPELIPTLLPADLFGLDSYISFLESSGAGRHDRLIEDLRSRLSWEATMEFGLNARVGRTLENTQCSTVEVDLDAIKQASEILAMEIRENLGLTPEAVQSISTDDVSHFLGGLLNRMRLRGGIDNRLLAAYIKNEGKWFHLTKRRQALMSPFSGRSVLPRFMTNKRRVAGVSPVFDSFIGRSKSPHTWSQDWASRSLGLDPTDPAINEIYAEAFGRLESVGLAKRHDLTGSSSAWALNPEKLRTTPSTRQLRCPSCRRSVTLSDREAAAWEGRRCTQYRCSGDLELTPQIAQSYYGRIYRSGRLKRIFAHEHTGLLAREDREAVEEEFKSGNKPGAINLFVCTPTLEMGIDIGDLSAAMLCSVPPTTSNYLQRIGRAGRSTGNAFTMTLANSRPHDLYFHTEPAEMMSGEVLPPGCFLDAPEMLQRQLIAHAMDAWASQADGAKAIPSQTGFILSESGRRDFPGKFIDFYRANRESLTEKFLRSFDGYLGDSNRERLREFSNGELVPQLVDGAFDKIQIELKELRNLQERAKRRLQEIENSPDAFESPEDEKLDLEQTRKLLGRLSVELRHKYPLNVLTDDGVLPNYAFPEPGVKLESVVSHMGEDGKREYVPREYMRPASSALRELAPFNTFYADGRKVSIDEIDIGSNARPMMEHWRLCQECSFMRRELADQVIEAECPRCRNVGWSDSGQVRTLIHFRRSRSLATRLESSTADDTEEREEAFYDVLDMVDVGPENYNGAKIIKEIPFGYELLKNLKLREINFGLDAHGPKHGLKVRGEPIAEKGFDVCFECGRVRGHDDKIHHGPTCKYRRADTQEVSGSIFLYREIESEAIRILLPVSEVDLETKRASFRAALELGFRRHFEGDPGHLIVRSVREPIPGGYGSRQYLVVFDGVPGGTGYLSELWQEGHFLDVLQKALDALVACQCTQDPDKDGCYRCVFAYQTQRELPLVSSREAQETLRNILDQRDKLEEIQTLSEVSLETKLESELEEKFLYALRDRASKTKGLTWEEKVRGGDVFWVLRTETQSWEVIPQVDLGTNENVVPSCRPDFLIQPANADPGIRPIAVFCDGLAYHACPSDERGRVWDDVAKRSGIIHSGRYQVWSVTWKDVEDFEEGPNHTTVSPLFGSIAPALLGRILSTKECTLERSNGVAGSMEMLLRYLTTPDRHEWEKLASSYAFAWLTDATQWIAPEAGSTIESRLESEPMKFLPGPSPQTGRDAAVLTKFHFGTWFAFLARSPSSALKAGNVQRMVLRIFDENSGRSDAGFEADWRSFLHLWNFIQFCDGVEVTSSELIQKGIYPPVAEDRSSIAAETPEVEERIAYDDEHAELLEYATQQGRPLIQAVIDAGLSPPTDDFELSVAGDGCGPEAELAWVNEKVAVLAARQAEDRDAYEHAGWTVFEYPVNDTDLLEALGSLTNSGDNAGDKS